MATYSSRIETAPAARWNWGSGLITRERVAPAVAGAVLLVIWEVWVRSQLPDFVARPSGIVMAIPSTITTGEFWSDVGATLGAILEGVAIGSVAGVLIGVAMGRVREIDWFLSTYIRALYALPLIALVPIVILWVGYQPAARARDCGDLGVSAGCRHHGGWHAGDLQGLPGRRKDVRRAHA